MVFNLPLRTYSTLVASMTAVFELSATVQRLLLSLCGHYVIHLLSRYVNSAELRAELRAHQRHPVGCEGQI